ncbi:lanC-like protein 2 [Homarus americanus]|uniref:lanC-like protein 2 n=1 Tax=Homarus americanus TaxID=6706 RepID=UPI001C476ED0|nr:lanC-like protein 2 [Homarus americanus]XP_042216663.1 lanC-like protein 2 [Homarus americanus]
MSEMRYFTNPYPKDVGEDSQEILDDTKQKLSQQYISKTQKSIDTLQKVLDEGLSKGGELSDYSVYTGTSGYVLLYLHLAEILGDDTYLQKATPLVNKAFRNLKGRRLSFLCGDSGPLALAAILNDKTKEKEIVKSSITSIKEMERAVLDIESDLPDELLFGRAGYLYALLLIQKKIGKEVIDDKMIRSVVTAILHSGRALSRTNKWTVPLMYQWHDKHYLGAAHGIAGIMFMLLQVKEHLTLEELTELIQPTVDYLCNLQFPSGNMPSSTSNPSDKLVHWCHGAPGSLFLFAKAYQIFGDTSYLEYAKKCGECIWERGLLKKGYGLCHGSAGNGYAMLYLYQVTGDAVYLYRAAQFGNWCQDYGTHGCLTPDRPLSLFEGLAGNIHFLVDLINPDEAKFPAFVL